MLEWVLLALLLGISTVVFCREVLIVGEGRRSGDDVKMLYNRFRRRVKGLLLLIVLYVLTAWYETFSAVLTLDKHGTFLYVGVVLIFMFWVMILAARDFKESALLAIAAQQAVRREIEQKIDEALDKRKHDDRKRITPTQF